MPQQITVRVELGPYVLLGREVEFAEVHQAVGDHAVCAVSFDRDPRSASPLAAVQLADLADALVRVVFLDAAGDGAAGTGGCLAFEGRVREARVAHQPAGGGRFTVTAVSDSHTLAAHADRRYWPQQTLAGLAGALHASVAGALPEGEARDYVQRGESDWALLARAAAAEGAQLRAVWPRGAEDGPAAAPAELGQGFANVTHALTWGRDLLGFETVLRPVNPGVTGAFYDPAAKHDHRFRGVRQKAAWLGGARGAVEAAERAGTADAGGGDPGHVEVGVGGGLGGARARTQEEFRARLERASAARAGAAVQASGTSVQPALRAGDRLRVQEGDPGPVAPGAATGQAAPTDAPPDAPPGTPSGASNGGAGATAAGASAGDGAAPSVLPSAWGDNVGASERAGVYGLVRVSHRWTGTQYENEFEATPWADYHPSPANAERQLATSPAQAGADAAGTEGAGALAAGGLALAVVVANDDPKRRGRVRVRYAWMAEGEATHWIRVTGLGGGNTRGVGALPSVGDEVVVAAVAGDPEHPVVLGALWNGVDKAGHFPGRQHWVTPAGNTLVFLEGEPGDDAEKVELHTREAKAWVQLAQRGPTGVPTVTVYSDGDLSLEAPNGQLRLSAKSYLAHVAESHATNAGPVTVKSSGAVTVESGAALGLKAAANVVVMAGGSLRAHAAGSHTLTGSQVTLNPPGAGAPTVTASVAPLPGSAWGPRPVPAPGPGRSTEDPVTPTRRQLAARAQRTTLTPDQTATGSTVANPAWASADDPTLAAPAGPGAGTPKPSLTPEQQKLHDIKALLRKAPSGRAALQYLDQHKVPATFKPGGGSYWNPTTKSIVIDQAQSTQAAALTLVHEVNHARATLTGTSGDAAKQSRADYLTTMINEESVGTVASIVTKRELVGAGEKITAVFPLEPEYNAAYAAATAAAKAANPHASAQAVTQAGMAAGLRRVITGFNAGEVVASTTKTPYPATYGAYWDAVAAFNKKKGGP